MTLRLWCCGGTGGEGPLADVMDVRERLSQAPSGVSQHLSSVDYVVGCSYTQGASSCCLLTCTKLGSSKVCMTQIHVCQICLTHAAAVARSRTCHPQDLAVRSTGTYVHSPEHAVFMSRVLPGYSALGKLPHRRLGCACIRIFFVQVS